MGLWRLDPATDAITQVSTDALPSPEVFVGQSADSEVGRSTSVVWWSGVSKGDLSASAPYVVYFEYLSGAAGQQGETWFQHPGFSVTVIGVDTAERAFVVAQSTSQVEVWVLATPTSAT